MQFPNNLELYLKHMLKYGGGVLLNTPTEQFENVLFWTFNQSGQVEYAIDFGKSDHFESSGVISFLESKADLNKFFKPSLLHMYLKYRREIFRD